MSTEEDFLASLKHEAFMLGTSKTRHNGGGFDLIITTAPIPDLNQKINIFGRVIKGEDIVQVTIAVHFFASPCDILWFFFPRHSFR